MYLVSFWVPAYFQGQRVNVFCFKGGGFCFMNEVPFEHLTDAISAESMGGLKLLRTSKMFKILILGAFRAWKRLGSSKRIAS